MQYKWHTESIFLNSIVVLKSEKSASLFLEKIYPYWTESVIVSADGAFPKDQQLKEFAFEQLKTNKDLPVILFNGNLQQQLEIVSNKILPLDIFFRDDMYRFDASEAYFNWNERSIARLCFQWVNLVNKNSRETYIDMREMFNPESIKWYINMVYE